MKRCVICEKEITGNGIKNVSTCSEECRNVNARRNMEKINSKMKKEGAVEILEFLDKKFSTEIDLEKVLDIIMEVSIHNIPISDFVMTAYYVVAKENINSAISMRDIEIAGAEWDALNGGIRVEKEKKKMKKKIRTLEKIYIKQKDPVLKEKTLGKMKRIAKEMEIGIKIGFSDKAYKKIQESFDISFKDPYDEMIACLNEKLGRVDLEKAIPIYERNKNILSGRNPRVIAAALFYRFFVSSGEKMSIEEVARSFKVSRPSIDGINKLIS